ncbi:MAG: T9SS type A sorting domain-containing protein [Chitinophagales bacterium]|nr:T9SS type A sorting domain-containing protein [Chitinophagales bacterium]
MKKFLLIMFLASSIFTSAQNTITWTIETEVAMNSYENLHPRIVTNGSGDAIVIWGRASDESIFISRWDGSSFTMPVKLNPSWLTIATASWMGPDIAAKGDTVYVVMKQTPEADITSHIYIVSSFDGGMTFSDPVQIDFIADSISRFPTVTVDVFGHPIIGFMKFDPGFANARWVVTRSNDFGNTFSPDVLASGWSGVGATVCDCCPGSITTSGSTVAMLYRDNLDNLRDSWVGISNDSGNTFTLGLPIDQNNWIINICPSTGPDGVIIGDTLYSTFMNGAGGMNLNYFSKTSLSSLTGAVGIALIGNIAGVSSQNYPRIASAGNAYAIAWKQHVNGGDQLALRFTNELHNGLPEGFDTVDVNDITNTDVALTTGNIFIVWQDDNAGTVQFRQGTFSLATGLPSAQIGNFNSVFPNPASREITLDLSLDILDEVTITITDLTGRNIFSTAVPATSHRIRFDIANWENGIYFLTVQSGNNSTTHKICKAN